MTDQRHAARARAWRGPAAARAAGSDDEGRQQRQHRHQPRRHIARVGHRPVSERRRRARARGLHHPRGRWVQHRRHDVRRQDPAPQHRPRGPLPRSHRRSRHPRPGPARGREDGERRQLAAATRQRYAGWERDLGQKILAGKLSLADLSKQVLDTNLEPRPKSGRQEFLENLANRYV
jgi:hypothetical protein